MSCAVELKLQGKHVAALVAAIAAAVEAASYYQQLLVQNLVELELRSFVGFSSSLKSEKRFMAMCLKLCQLRFLFLA